jgi:hypothetical protein
MRCQAITQKGTRCKADARAGAEHCYSHDLSRAEERARIASKAGRRGGKGRPRSASAAEELSTIKGELAQLYEDVREGRVRRDVGGVLATIENVRLRTVELEFKRVEADQLLERLEALERARGLQPAGGRNRPWTG